MKPRHLIAIVLIGTGLIIVAPTSEKSGRAEKTSAPTQDVNVKPPQEGPIGQTELQAASFEGDARAQRDPGN